MNLHSLGLGTPLHAASRGGYARIVRWLIAGGAEITAPYSTRMPGHQISALHDVVLYGHVGDGSSAARERG
jgi:hypothetical protein